MLPVSSTRCRLINRTRLTLLWTLIRFFGVGHEPICSSHLPSGSSGWELAPVRVGSSCLIIDPLSWSESSAPTSCARCSNLPMVESVFVLLRPSKLLQPLEKTGTNGIPDASRVAEAAELALWLPENMHGPGGMESRDDQVVGWPSAPPPPPTEIVPLLQSVHRWTWYHQRAGR